MEETKDRKREERRQKLNISPISPIIATNKGIYLSYLAN
jgi:hypothetical protein